MHLDHPSGSMLSCYVHIFTCEVSVKPFLHTSLFVISGGFLHMTKPVIPVWPLAQAGVKWVIVDIKTKVSEGCIRLTVVMLIMW